MNFLTTAGSYPIGKKALELAVRHGLITLVHYDSSGVANCGGGGALSDASREATATAVGKFAVETLGATPEAGAAIEARLREMKLDTDPRIHAQRIADYNRTVLGIENQVVLIHDLRTGEMKVGAKIGDLKKKKAKVAVLAACADARHQLPKGTLADLMEAKLKTQPREQQAQNPTRMAVSRAGVKIKRYNHTFTVAGASDREVRNLLRKTTFSTAEAHTAAAAVLSAYYYHHHKWRGHERAISRLRVKKGR